MKNTFIQIALLLVLCVVGLSCSGEKKPTIDRKAVVDRHKIVSTESSPKSPAQVGNGEFAFAMDITGLQTFYRFNTMSHWSWHSAPMDEKTKAETYNGVEYQTCDGKTVIYENSDPKNPNISEWLGKNPHRYNLGRIGFLLTKKDGTEVVEADLQNAKQEVDLWTGLVTSTFEIEGDTVQVVTSCHAGIDAVAAQVKSPLIVEGRLKVFFDFPYTFGRKPYRDDYVGTYDMPDAHFTKVQESQIGSLLLERVMDDVRYYVTIEWNGESKAMEPTKDNPHRFVIEGNSRGELDFVCAYDPTPITGKMPTVDEVERQSAKLWKEFWMSGAAIDLSESTDERWKELERRIVLSQYVMRMNEAGSYPPQESGLVNNGWYGRFHFEMIWWHKVHYALWNRMNLADKSMTVYEKFLPTSIERASKEQRAGARWPKCTADIDREWPGSAHAFLIWQQPHPIYFAEMEYRIDPTKETFDKWNEVVKQSADYMADFACYDEANDRYILGAPICIVSENSDYMTTNNPTFELAYWRYGLRTAIQWAERAGETPNPKWKEVLDKLAQLPVEDGVYINYEGMQDQWTKYNFEHPALTGVYGMLPGDGVDMETFKKTLYRVEKEWQLDKIWGWDFPMMAMAAARTGDPALAVDMLTYKGPKFDFDVHGLAEGGPFPYFPANGGLLTAIGMMCEGWDGGPEGHAPGFPQDGSWIVKYEGFNKMQ